MALTIPNTSTPLRGWGNRIINFGIYRWLGLVTVSPVIGRWWQLRRTRRALMELSAWQRADCGIERPDIPCTCDLEKAARRDLANGVHNYRC
jgi:uncharacterized protein YjiS (DUF1127 family)